MAININRIKKHYHKIRSHKSLLELQDIQRGSKGEKGFRIVPFVLSMGYINSAEIGKFGKETKISSLTQFSRIFTGSDNLIAKWEGAYSITRRSDKNLQKTYKVGKSFLGYIDSEVMGSSFNNNTFDGDFINWKNERSLTLITFENLGDEDVYKLYVIPEIGGNAFWYVAPNGLVKQYSTDKKEVRVELTLNKLNGQLSKSGQALEQFIQMGAAGEGYAWPKVINGVLQLDNAKTLDIPIQEIQKEFSGVAAISTFYAWGRPTKTKTINGVKFNDFNPIIEPPRLLLPYEMRTPEPSPLTTRGANETDFYVVREAIPTYEQDFDHWRKYIETSQKDTISLKNYEGFLSSVESLKDIQATNPEDKGQPKFTIFNNLWKVDLSNKSYWNNVSSIMAKNKLTFPEYSELTITQIMAHNVFTTEHLLTLPMSLKNNIQWNLEDVPLIGGFLSKITLGLPIGWKNSSFRVANKPIALIVPKTIAEYTQQISEASSLKIPLGFFGSDSNSLIQDVGISSISTNIKIALTDQFWKVNSTGQLQIYPTSALTSKHPTYGQILWDESCIPAAPNSEGFVIDAIIDKAISKSKTRLTCYSNGLEVWQGSYNTKALHTGNIRDWASVVKMSNWEIDRPDGVPWPSLINPIAPNDYLNATITNTKGEKAENIGYAIAALSTNTITPYTSGTKYPPHNDHSFAFGENNAASLPFPPNVSSFTDLKVRYKTLRMVINGSNYEIDLGALGNTKTKIVDSGGVTFIGGDTNYQVLETTDITGSYLGDINDFGTYYTKYTLQEWRYSAHTTTFLTIRGEAQRLWLELWANVIYVKGNKVTKNNNDSKSVQIRNTLHPTYIEYIARE